MPLFHYSLQARMDDPREGFHNIGVMVWSDNTLDYFGVRGEGAHAREMNERIAKCKSLDGRIEDFVEYYLTRHGGFFYSMARPERVDHESAAAVARHVGDRWDLDFVIPEPPVPKIDPDEAARMMAATEMGFDVVVRGRDY